MSDTETDVVAAARSCCGDLWELGRLAAEWTQRHARGRTDADLARLIGDDLVSADQVQQRRQVWERFAESRSQWPGLAWSHFYAALRWDDAADCLEWASALEATVAEMRAWRRVSHGEDAALPDVDETVL
jgi:hypothetical protein